MTDASQQSQLVLSGLGEALAALQHLHGDVEAQAAHANTHTHSHTQSSKPKWKIRTESNPPEVQTSPDGGEVAPAELGDHLVPPVEDVAHLDGMVAAWWGQRGVRVKGFRGGDPDEHNRSRELPKS